MLLCFQRKHLYDLSKQFGKCCCCYCWRKQRVQQWLGHVSRFNEMPTRFYWKVKGALNNCRQYLTFCQSNAEKTRLQKMCVLFAIRVVFRNLKNNISQLENMLGCIWHRYVDLVWIWLMHVTWCDIAYK